MLPNFRKSENEPHSSEDTPPPVSRGPEPPHQPQPRPTSAAPTRVSDRAAPSVIGHDLSITGNMVSKGEIQIDGEIQGDVKSTHVMVGEKALITGSIAAEEVVIRGKVMGSVRGKRVLLQKSSHVEGDIYHQALAIEQGAFFEGKSRRSSEPLAHSQGTTTATARAPAATATTTTTSAPATSSTSTPAATPSSSVVKPTPGTS